jgi:uncharacterized protein (TIGR00369 family)
MELQNAQHMLNEIFAPWVRDLGLQAEHVSEGEVVLRLPFDRKFVHVGGVICGQVFMAAADTAMVLAVTSTLDEFKPMTTVTLNTSFLRPVGDGDVKVTARVLRRGRNLVYGEIELADANGKLAAHATTTYALL